MKIYSIIVCYQPDVSAIELMVKKLLSSQSFVIIVDNSEGVPVSQWINFKGCTIVPMGTNTGIAYAQNVGIRLAIKQKADVVVFFDQDSEIEDDFLSTLLYPLMPGKPGVVAPIYFDKARGYEFPAMKLNSFGTLSKVYRDNNSVSYPVDVVISSGMAVTKETFEVVGLMDEEFFIDFVDTEWCLRCRSKKVEILMVSAATMAHSIGDSSRNLGFMNIFVHSPIRSYYQIRNSFHFLKKKHVPLLLGLKEFLSLLLHHIIGLIFLKDRKAYLIQYFHAVRDGILGICGKKSELEIIK